MPNRILKESICTSDSIDGLTWFEEVLFYRLIVNCDDYGRFDGRTAVIKNRLFPLKDIVTTKSVETAIAKLVSAELVALYEFEGKPYLHLPTWSDHQQVRSKRSRYPAPTDKPKQRDIICNHMISDDSTCSRNPIQSESESESEAEAVCARVPAAATTPAQEPVIGIDGTDLSESIRINAEVDALLRTYRLSEALRGDLLEDIDKHGLEKVKRVLQDAAKADTKGGLSLNFYRACLANDGKPKPARSSPGKSADIMQRYSQEERRASYSAAVVDLDEEVI